MTRNEVESSEAKLAREREAVSRSPFQDDTVSRMLESIAEGLVVISTEGQILQINSSAAKMFGYSNEELLGIQVETLIPETRRVAHKAHLRGFFQNPKSRPMGMGRDLTGLKKDGSEFFIEVAIGFLDVDPDVLFGIAFVTDISARKKAENDHRMLEQKLSAILSGMTDLVLLLNSDRKVVWTNEPAREFFNSPGHTVKGLSLDSIGEQIDLMEEHSEIVLKRDETTYTFWVTSNKLEEDPSTHARGRIVMFRDISSKKEAEREILHALAVKSEFTSMVSHELRTPLAALSESIGLVEDGTCGPLNEEQADYLGMSKRNIDRLARLINDVLYYQKLDAEKVVYKKQVNDLDQTIVEVQKSLLPMMSKGAVDLLTDLEENLPKFVFDKDRIVQVFMNLLNNALKFTEQGSITIGTRREGDEVLISIADTGIGIKKEDLEFVFQSFSQVAGTIDHQTGSSGLGLAICRKIVAQHNGKIWAESEYGKGTTFFFRLPLVEDVLAETPEEERALEQQVC